MNASAQTKESVFRRVLWLYGAYMLLSNTAYLIGYYFLPEGLMRSSPHTAAGRLIASSSSFGMEFVLTLAVNLGVFGLLVVLLNVNHVNGMPTGYAYPLCLGIVSGLISGTNSFAASDLTRYNAWDGMALGLSIGNLEMLGYVCVIAATVRLGIYQYRSWWRWSGEWKAVKTSRLQDVRFDRFELAVLVVGIGLIGFAAYRETLMAWGML